MLRKGHGGLYKAPTKEERRKRKAKRRERNHIKFIDLGFERWQVVSFRKARRRQDVGCVCGAAALLIVPSDLLLSTHLPILNTSPLTLPVFLAFPLLLRACVMVLPVT